MGWHEASPELHRNGCLARDTSVRDHRVSVRLRLNLGPRRAGLETRELQALAQAHTLKSLEGHRRWPLWARPSWVMWLELTQ